MLGFGAGTPAVIPILPVRTCHTSPPWVAWAGQTGVVVCRADSLPTSGLPSGGGPD